MADDINKKISIDIEINTDGQQQINEYKTSIDNLRNTITNLGKPLNDVSNNINAFNDNLNKVSSSGNKVTESVSGLTESFKFVTPLLDVVKTGFVSLEEAITGGLAVLITFAPEILKWAASLLKGKEAITQAKLSMDTLNKALKSSDYSNAIQQMNELKINVGLAKKGFLDKKEVLEQYNSTLGKTMGKTTDINKVEAILVSKGGAYIKMTLLKAEAQQALQTAAQKALEVEQEKLKSDSEVLTWWDKTVTALKGVAYSTDGIDGFAVADAEQAVKAQQRRQDATKDLNKQKDDYLAIANTWEQQAAALAKKNGFDFFSGTMTSSGNSTKPKPNLSTPAGLTPDKFPTPAGAPGDPDMGDATAQLAKDDEANQKANAQKQEDIAKQTLQKIIADATAIKAENQKNEDAARQARNKQIEDEALQAAQKIATEGFAILQNSIKQQADAKIAALESQKNNELNNTNLTSAQKIAIEAKVNL